MRSDNCVISEFQTVVFENATTKPNLAQQIRRIADEVLPMPLIAAHRLPYWLQQHAASFYRSKLFRTGPTGVCIPGTAPGRLVHDPAAPACRPKPLHHQAQAPCQ